MTKSRQYALVATAIVLAVGATVTLRIRAHRKAVSWALYADMHNLALAQAAHFYDYHRFDSGVPSVYQPEWGATVKVTSATDTSWTAVATHPKSSKTCTIAYAEPRNATESQVAAARHAAMESYACR